MNVLDFQTDKLITGVNIIEGNLYWTDNNSEPKKLEIERFKKSDIGLNDGATTINDRLFDHTDITVIRPHPAKAIELDLTDYDDASFDTQRVTSPEPPFEQIFPRFSYRWRYEDGQYSPYAPFTQAAFMPKARNYGTADDPQSWDPNSAYNHNGTNGVIVNFGSRSYENNTTVIAAIPPLINPEPNASTDWDDLGEAILTSREHNYIEGFNTTMFNNVGRISLNNIPRGTPDVVEVDILYTESISSTIYVLETLLIPLDQRGIDFKLNSAYTRGVQGLEPDPNNPGGFLPPRSGILTSSDYSIQPLNYSITTRKIYNALPANQLSRQFDDVPRLAKAQEVTANRLVYGNYLHQYDQLSGVSLDVTAIPAESFPHLNDAAIIANRLAASATDGLHVKGNRTYEIGVAYIDAFGRQGAMLQNVSSFNADGTLNEANAFRTAFNQPTREALQVTITTPAPAWAKSYRYFIKDTSTDYQNLVSYSLYNDGSYKEVNSEFVWIEFQSTDRNKVQGGPGDAEASVLTVRRINDDIQNTKTRYLVQDIENECPEVVRKQINRSIVSSETANTGSFNHAAYNTVTNLTTGPVDPGTVNGQTSFFLAPQSTGAISIFQSQVVGAFNSFITRAGGTVLIDTNVTATIDFTDFGQPLYARLRQPDFGFQYATGGEDNFVEILSISTHNVNSGNNMGRIGITFGDRFLVNSATREIEKLNIGTGLSSTVARDLDFELLTTAISDTAVERLEGKFWVKTARNSLVTQQSTFTFEGALKKLTPHWFETEPITAESNLDLFWETSDTFCVCQHHGCPNKLNWFNSVAEVDPTIQANLSADPPVVAFEGGVYLETTRMFDKFNSVQLVRGVRVNTPTSRYAQERKPYGLTWSGIYNSRTGINRLNQFITSDGITKELEPNYGSLQLLHTRDTNLIAACEDKIFRILADKDLLYNADGGGNVSASNRVLGQTTPFVGEYGISKNPESFASYGNNFWITDAARGVVLQVTPANGQINEISSMGLKDHFRDRLHSADKLIGAYDDYSSSYMLSMQGYDQNDAMIDAEDAINGETSDITWRYEPARQGWSSRVSYIPENGLSLNNKFYTYKSGKMFVHNSNNVPRNHFYNLPVKANPAYPGSFLPASYVSEIEVILNENPSALKDYLTLGYEGTQGWVATSIDTDSEDLTITNTWPFVKKEDKYFAPIVGQIPTYGLTNAGLGSVVADDGSTVFISGSQDKSGIKGFYNKVRLQNALETKAELFAINSENKISSN
jgi:hypothetical protein